MELKDISEKVDNIKVELDKAIARQDEEIKTHGAASTEAKNAVVDLTKRLDELQVKLERPGGAAAPAERKSLGKQFVESEQYKAMIASGRFESNAFETKDLISSDAASAGDLVVPMRVPGIVTPPTREFRIRDLLAQGNTQSNLVEFVVESGFVSEAAPVAEGKEGSDLGGEKPESAITFEKASEPVITIAHWIPATRAIIADAPALQAYINNRLIYGLKIAEEDQLLNGAGGGTELNGLVTQQTAFDPALLGVDDNIVDVIRRAVLQARLAEYPVDGVVLHPTDWANIELAKDDEGRYIWVTVPQGGEFKLWRVPVVETTAITEGTFLVGAFKLGAQIWDRENVSIRISEHHADYFTRNLVAILCEERLALTVFRPEAFVGGALAVGS